MKPNRCKRAMAALLSVALLFTFAGCKSASEKDCITLGVNLALTGDSAPYGTACLAGICLAVDAQNKAGGVQGKQIALRVIDNASRSDLAALATLQLQADPKVAVMLGPSLSHLVKAAAEQLDEMNMLTPGATSDTLAANPQKVRLFRLCFTDQVQGEALAEYAYGMGKRRMAIFLDISSDYAKGISRAFQNAFEAMGGQVVCSLTYPPKEIDFYPLLMKASAACPDGLFVPGFYEQGGLLIAQASEVGLDLPIFSGDGFDSPALRQIVANPEALEQVYFSDHALVTADHPFAKAYFAENDSLPSAYSALGYDTALAVLAALKETQVQLLDKDRKAFHKLLYQNIANCAVDGVTGRIRFDSFGNAIKQPVLITYAKGQLTLANKPTQGGDLA